jgi:cytochrome c551
MFLALVVVAAPLFADGAAVYKAKCAMCHGPDGAGQTPTGKSMKVRDLGSADVQKQSDADLTKIITDGKGKMPAYKGKLTPAEITSVIEVIRKMKK